MMRGVYEPDLLSNLDLGFVGGRRMGDHFFWYSQAHWSKS